MAAPNLVGSSAAYVIPCTVEHYLAAAVGGETWVSPRECAEQLTTRGPAWAGFYGDSLLGCAGVMLPWSGLGEAWVLLTSEGRHHGRIVCRQIVRGFRTIIAEHHLRRVQADVYPWLPPAIAFVEWLGFTLETVMRQYAPDGGDMLRYVLFPKGAP